MKYSKNMLWAETYVLAASRLVDVSKIEKIVGYALKPGQVPRQAAVCIKSSRSRHTIRVRLTSDHDTNKSILVEDALVALAHELAHLVVWEHKPKHLELTARILAKFARVARAQGVKDTSGYLQVKLQ